MRVLRSAIAVVGLIVASAAYAQPLDIAIDIDSARTSGAATGGTLATQSGFTSWDLTSFTDPSTPLVVDGVTFEIFGTAANNSRVRTTGGGGAFDALLADFVFNEGANGRAVGLRISDLEVGTYAMQSWHYDSTGSVTSTSNFMNIETRDQGIAGSTIDHVFGFPFSTTPAFFKFDVTATGQVKEIIFREDDVDDPETIDVNEDNNRARLNGFTLRQVPEPGSLALALLGLGLLWGCGRRDGRLSAR